MQNRNLVLRAIGYIFGQRNQPRANIDDHILEIFAAVPMKKFKERLAWVFFKEEDLSDDERSQYEKYIDNTFHLDIMTLPVILDGMVEFKMDYYELETWWNMEFTDDTDPTKKIKKNMGLNPRTREPYRTMEVDMEPIREIEKFVEQQEEKYFQLEIARKEKQKALRLELEKKLTELEAEKKSLVAERKQFEAEKALFQLQLKEKLPAKKSPEAAPDPDDIINFAEEPSEPMSGSWLVLPDINGIAPPGVRRNPSPATTTFFSPHRQFTMGLPYMLLFPPTNRGPNTAASNNHSNNADANPLLRPNGKEQSGE